MTLVVKNLMNVLLSGKDEYATRIKSQWASLGLSLDYSREQFTLDDNFNEAVNTLFIRLYEDGLFISWRKEL